MEVSWKYLLLALGLFFVLLLESAFVVLRGIAGPACASRDFDPHHWQADFDRDARNPPRMWMREAARDKLLREKPRHAEVRRLLGPPDGANQESWWYDLGFPNLPVDPKSLLISFDSVGRVQEVVFFQH